MQRIIIGISVIVVLILIGVGAVTSITRTQSLENENQTSTPSTVYSEYENTRFGFTLRYPVGDEGLVLEERSMGDADAPLLHTLTFMKKAEFERMRTLPSEGSEGPASITIHILRNDQNKFSLGTAEQYPLYTNFGLRIGDTKDRVVGGANGIEYRTDGLYLADTIVVNHGQYSYILIGQFTNEEDSLRSDFEDIVDSLNFIPEIREAQGGLGTQKINIDVVCESALVYMSFPNGEMADAFLVECKEGKHPEVFERFRAEQGLGDNVAI